MDTLVDEGTFPGPPRIHPTVEPSRDFRGIFQKSLPDLSDLVVQVRTRAETMELAQANARILIEVYLSEKLPLPAALRRVLKRKSKVFNLSLPVSMPVPG